MPCVGGIGNSWTHGTGKAIAQCWAVGAVQPGPEPISREVPVGIIVRPMKADDIMSVRRIVQECYEFLAQREGFTLEQIRRLVEERCSDDWIGEAYARYQSFVALVDQAVVGVVGIEGNDVAELFVRPDHHCRGVGSILFETAEQAIADAGHSELTVRTTGYATGFYERMGAQTVGKMRCPHGPLVGWELTCLRKSISIPTGPGG